MKKGAAHLQQICWSMCNWCATDMQPWSWSWIKVMTTWSCARSWSWPCQWSWSFRHDYVMGVGWCWDHIAMGFKGVWDHFRMILGWFRHDFGIILAASRNHFGKKACILVGPSVVSLGSNWIHHAFTRNKDFGPKLRAWWFPVECILDWKFKKTWKMANRPET